MSILLKKLDDSISMVLDEYDSIDAPTLYAIKSTPEGRKSIIKLVRQRVIQQSLGIYEALQSIESEFSEI